MRQTNRLRYGADYPYQNHDIRVKSQQRYSYDGISFDSKPELAYYVWLKDTGADFEYQPDTCFEYEYGGRRCRYFPDFRVGDGYAEIKGDQFLNEDGTWRNPYDSSLDGKMEAKRRCCLDNGVKIMYSADYAPFVDYAGRKYGKDWLDSFRK